MSRPLPSHRVDVMDEDHEPNAERMRSRDKSPPRAPMSDRERERDRAERDRSERDRRYDRSYHDHPYHPDYYRMPPPPYAYPPHMYSPYYGMPAPYHQPQQQGAQSPQSYGQQGHWDPQTQGQIQPHVPAATPAQNSPASTSAPVQNQHNQHGYPMMQPQYLAVNVKTDTHQTQSQDQSQTAENKQITIKEKIVHNTAKGLEHLLDPKVLAAGVGAIVLQHFFRQARENVQKGKKKALNLSLGFW